MTANKKKSSAPRAIPVSNLISDRSRGNGDGLLSESECVVSVVNFGNFQVFHHLFINCSCGLNINLKCLEHHPSEAGGLGWVPYPEIGPTVSPYHQGLPDTVSLIV